MKIMNISFFVTEMGHEKDTILIVHVIFSNKDISIIITDIILKFCILFFCDLKNVLKISKKVPDFLHNMKTKGHITLCLGFAFW